MRSAKENDDAELIMQKIKQLRKNKGITQDDLALRALLPEKKVARVETRKEWYRDDDVVSLKKVLDVDGMPLTKFQCEAFKGRLYIWRDEIRSKNMEKASEMREEMALVVNLDACDFDLPILYRIFEVLYFLTKGELDVAEEKLRYLDSIVGKMSVEHLYYYNCQKGTFNALRNNHEDAITYYDKALEIKKNNKDFLPNDEGKLYYGLAWCYTEIEQPSLATFFLNKMSKPSFSNKATPRGIRLDIIRAINYFKIGIYKEAEEILNDCYTRATSAEDRLCIGLSLHNLGRVHKHSENWKKAIKCFEHALNYFEENTKYYEWTLFWKICCKVETTKLNDLLRELMKMRSSFKDNTILFETLKHIININKSISSYNRNAVKYIEEIAVPYFIENNSRLDALYCYKLLDRHFIKNKQQKKSLEANRAMLEIRERMM